MKTALMMLILLSARVTAQEWVYVHAGTAPTNLPGTMLLDMSPARERVTPFGTLPPMTGWHSPLCQHLRRQYGDKLFQGRPPYWVDLASGTISTNATFTGAQADCAEQSAQKRVKDPSIATLIGEIEELKTALRKLKAQSFTDPKALDAFAVRDDNGWKEKLKDKGNSK